MKKIFLFLLWLYSITLYSQNAEFKLNAPSSEFNVTDNSFSSFSVSTSFSGIMFTSSETVKGNFLNLQISNCIKDLSRVGKPQLPVLNKLIDIPQNASVEAKIISYDEETINLSDHNFNLKIMPVQPPLPKNKKPSDVKFYYDESSYMIDEFNDSKLAEVTILGTMRGTRLGRLTINPVKYNPVKNIVKIYNNIVVQVIFNNADLNKTLSFQEKNYSPFFASAYKNVINYSSIRTKDTLVRYPVKYVIISDSMFRQTLQPFIQWKTRKGFNVIQAYTSEPAVGNTTTSIHQYLQNLYDSATVTNPAPSFVLFVGDVDQIPAYTGQQGDHPTDLYYCEFTGDNFPEMYYGRFSANNVAELQPQIDKTLEYEQYLMPDPSYLDSAVMIAGNDESGGTYSLLYANGQINYGVNYYFNPAHNINSSTFLYPQTDSANIQPVIANILSTGVGFANYTAHGSSSGWADPSFLVTDVPNMHNAHKCGLMIGNCCQTNTYSDYECFGEALLRAVNKGAVGYIGATDYSYWDEDYYFGVGAKPLSTNPVYNGNLGFYDRTFHDHGEPASEWYASQGQAIFAGNLAVTESGSSLTSYYWEVYQLMGDPSLMPYYSVPMPLTAIYNNPIATGTNILQVTTLPGAYVAISHKDSLLDAKVADNSGIATLNFHPFLSPDTADIVITAQNCSPFRGTVNIIPNIGAYVTLNHFSINDSAGNNNSQADYNENIHLNISLKNFGNLPAKNVSVKLAIIDSCVVLTDSICNWGNISPDSSSVKTGAFALQIKNNIPDQHIVNCKLTMLDSAGTAWTSTLSFALNAPVLSVTSISVNDSSGNNNHRLDTGEYAKICIVVKNSGHSISPFTSATLVSSSPDLSILVDSLYKGQLPCNNNQFTFSFSVHVSDSIPLGSIAPLVFKLSAFPYSFTKHFYLTLNQLIEDWEDSSFTHFPWVNNSYKPWVIITGSNVFAGKFSAKSGAISDNDSSKLSLSVNFLTNDTISFYKKVSCEPGYNDGTSYTWYDFLSFKIDGITQGRWDGEVPWSIQSYPLAAGNHTLEWKYQKDFSNSEGSDCAWLDNVIFQPVYSNNITSITTGNIGLIIYPNPFNDNTNIEYFLAKKSAVTLMIYDNLGRLKQMPYNNVIQDEGKHDFIYYGENLSPGIYICKLSVDDKVLYSKIIVMKK